MKHGIVWRLRAALPLLLAAPASAIWAHPGHEHPVVPPANPMHWFLEPEHALQGAGLLLLAFVSSKVGQHLRRAHDLRTPARQKVRD